MMADGLGCTVRASRNIGTLLVTGLCTANRQRAMSDDPDFPTANHALQGCDIRLG
jgi:hypothetical protein